MISYRNPNKIASKNNPLTISRSTAVMEAFMSQQHVLAVGDRMPDISLPTLKGDMFSLRDCRDKKYIIYMWASW